MGVLKRLAVAFLALAAVGGAGFWILTAPQRLDASVLAEAGQGDALYDLATLTLAHEEHLDDVIAGYGADVDLDLIRAWWSFRSLIAIRWLAENGYGSPETFPEVAVLRSRP